MSTAALGAPPAPAPAVARAVRTDVGAPLLPLPLARGLATIALAVFGGLHWMGLLEPAAAFRAWEAVGVAVLVSGGLLAAARAGTRELRWLAGALVLLAGVGLALLAGGLADEFLRPDRWRALAGGIGRGIETLPGARVPFRGLDEWTRLTLAGGGTLLIVLGAALAFWPRSGGRTGYPRAALVVLVTLYAVPSVALIFDREFVRGAVLLLLVLAFLRLERLRRSDARAAGLVAGAVGLLALAVAPVLDRSEPWWDYETWALSTAASKSAAFAWEHDYRPLDWPRDGRELLRVKAPKAAYWKAKNLDVFDGLRWRENLYPSGSSVQIPVTATDQARRRSQQRIRVSVRNLQSREIVTAGTPVAVDYSRGSVRTSGAYVTTGRPLRRGDVYTAEAYVPTPTSRQLRDAGTGYDEYWLPDYRSIAIPGLATRRGERVRFPAYGVEGEPELVDQVNPNFPTPVGGDLERSSLRRTWALAQRLRAGSSTPYSYVRRVESYLSAKSFSYTETPPPAAETLDGFLLDAKAGFCQQYSGAMALLLRMGGVPARVAAGFSPGSFDKGAGEFVVRDLDAHSWVEAWFPGHGWVTFDPTPTSAPARSQSQTAGVSAAAAAGVPSLGLSDRTSDPRTPLVATGSGPPWLLVVLGALAAAGGLGLAAAHRRRRRAAGEPAWAPALAELERALRRTGRRPGPGLTLRGLEDGFARSPGAQGYVRLLRQQRYGVAPAGARPTAEQRRGLRSELARGAGVAGTLRSWWALPPHVTSSAGRRSR